MTISRNPEDYYAGRHTINKAKERSIPFELIAETIAEGTIYEDHEKDCNKFVQDFGFAEHPICVVANVEQERIITAEWRYRGVESLTKITK